MIFGENWRGTVNCIANEWTTLEKINKPDITYGRTYLGVPRTMSISGIAGVTHQVRNPILVDLTAMFGAGNEPTTVAQF